MNYYMDKENSKGGEQPKKRNILRWDAVEPIRLFDQKRKFYVTIKLDEVTKQWERWVSFDKKRWVLETKIKSLEEVLITQQEIIDNNYRNLFDLMTKK